MYLPINIDIAFVTTPHGCHVIKVEKNGFVSFLGYAHTYAHTHTHTATIQCHRQEEL